MSGAGERAPRGGRVLPTPPRPPPPPAAGGAPAHAAPTCHERGENDGAPIPDAGRRWLHDTPSKAS
jgi:hypothetical protein